MCSCVHTISAKYKEQEASSWHKVTVTVIYHQPPRTEKCMHVITVALPLPAAPKCHSMTTLAVTACRPAVTAQALPYGRLSCPFGRRPVHAAAPCPGRCGGPPPTSPHIHLLHVKAGVTSCPGICDSYQNASFPHTDTLGRERGKECGCGKAFDRPTE